MLLLVLVQRQFLSLAMNAFISSKSRAGPGHRPANVEHLEAGGADRHRPLPEPLLITVSHSLDTWRTTHLAITSSRGHVGITWSCFCNE